MRKGQAARKADGNAEPIIARNGRAKHQRSPADHKDATHDVEHRVASHRDAVEHSKGDGVVESMRGAVDD